MRYDWKDQLGVKEFTREFYEEIDQRFFRNAWEFMPWQERPFDPLIDFKALPGQDVLEIGVGSGSHAGLLAATAKSFTGIDITEYAIKSTSERLRCFGLPGRALCMDAEKMEFADGSFDFIWSWGVIHHSANTRRVLEEIHRVLRPGGRTVIMVYHRSLWVYYVSGILFRGLLQGELLKTRSLHQTVQRATDGAIARYYSIPEWTRLVSDLFQVERIQIFGSKAELIPLPGGRLKTAIMNWIPNPLTAFFTNNCKLGSFLVSTLRKAS